MYPSPYHYRTRHVSVWDQLSTGGAVTAQEDFHLGAAITHEPHFGIGLPRQCSYQQQAQSAPLVGGGWVHADAVIVNDDTARRRHSKHRDFHLSIRRIRKSV